MKGSALEGSDAMTTMGSSAFMIASVNDTSVKTAMTDGVRR